jgi:hypothetical protein
MRKRALLLLLVAIALAMVLAVGGCASAKPSKPREVDMIIVDPDVDPLDAASQLCTDFNVMRIWDCPTEL